MTSPFDLIAEASALLEALHDRESPRVWRSLTELPDPPKTDPACLWAKARQRYLRRIARLPVPSPRPAWWTDRDEANRDRWDAPNGWSCRTCVLWRSPDGRLGVCGMPETPSTVNCGETSAGELCEQWAAWAPIGVRQEALEL